MAEDLELQERLGRGGMAEAWKAYDPQLQRRVVVKIFHTDLLTDADFMTRFRNLPRVPEAKLIASLQHPNIVQIYEVGEHEGRPYFALEYVEGGSLDQHLAGGPLSARTAGATGTAAQTFACC